MHFVEIGTSEDELAKALSLDDETLCSIALEGQQDFRRILSYPN